MRIIIITEKDEFYLPISIYHILLNCRHNIISVVCARNPLTSSTFKTAIKFYTTFGFPPLIKHAVRLFIAKFLDIISLLQHTKQFYSIKNVCKHFKIQYQFIRKLNSNEFLEYCKRCDVDLILSVSPTQIFGPKLISIPKFGCINVHSSWLPKYRGLYPTYWAMSKGETSIGVTVHCLEKGIDTGGIILQAGVEIPLNATLDTMLIRTKFLGAQLLLKTIELIASNKVEPQMPDLKKGSYYSFPTRKSYKDFIKRGYTLW